MARKKRLRSRVADKIKVLIHKNDYHPVLGRNLTRGQKAADTISTVAGSWTFILTLIFFLIGWIILNVTAYVLHWDPYPFILLNLVLSCVAALQAPIILMSQNRQAQKDRHKLEYDYRVNRKAEKEIEKILEIVKSLKK